MNPTVASLGMYPMPHLRAHWEHLWHGIAAAVPGAPRSLTWDRDLHDLWLDPGLVLGVTCGWPLVTRLGDAVSVVGTFDPAVPFASAGRYRSVLVASKPMSFGEWREAPGVVAAVNATDSLSGWVSLCHAWGGPPERTLVTGSHVDSLGAIVRGDAQVASIDAVTFELVADHDPITAGRVHIVGHGPRVPALPLVTSAANADRVGELRAAIAEAVGDLAMREASRALRIRGFVPLDRSDYEPLRALDQGR